MELLSPAGNWDGMTAAVQNGADAVYMGGGAYNARRSAGNFDERSMIRALDYCHVRGVKAYITLNTLLTDREMEGALKYAAFVYQNGADAVIVQDLGLASLIKKHIPSLPLHASTQMGIHTLSGALICRRMGIERAVLARELSLKDIAFIHERTDLALEAFAHGAMCMSFSGACLLSSMAGERSGNRGTCAQPCRKSASVHDGRERKNDYCLSLSDMCMLERLGDMERAGVSCIKLEGRMKRAEYVAVATRAYRAALDGAQGAELQELRRDLESIFSRGGFRTGYFYGDGCVTGCRANGEAPEELLARARASYLDEGRKRLISAHFYARIGEPAVLRLRTGDIEAQVSGAPPERARKEGGVERFKEQLGKLGATPFALNDIYVDADPWAYMPKSAVNQMRREACIRLESALAVGNAPPKIDWPPRVANKENKPFKTIITAQVRTLEQAKAVYEAGANEITLDPVTFDNLLPERLQQFRHKGIDLLLTIPVITASAADQEQILGLLQSGLFDGAVAQNPGHLPWMKGLKHRIAGARMNAMNVYAVQSLLEMGFTRVYASEELTRAQMRDMLETCGLSLQVYGRAQLMQLKHCPVKERFGCRGCHGHAGLLRDEEGRAFPLTNARLKSGCVVRLLNCRPTDIIDLYHELLNPESVLLAFDTEPPAVAGERVRAAVKAQKGESVASSGEITRGHWNRAVE